MWLFTKEGFFSIVRDTKLSDTFMIRSREVGDLENLKRLVGASTVRITLTPDADYPCRLIVSGSLKDIIIRALADGIDYGNFKSEVHRRPDQKRKYSAYMTVWSTMRATQLAQPSIAPAKRTSAAKGRGQSSPSPAPRIDTGWFEDDPFRDEPEPAMIDT